MVKCQILLNLHRLSVEKGNLAIHDWILPDDVKGPVVRLLKALELGRREIHSGGFVWIFGTALAADRGGPPHYDADIAKSL